jgi:hypothetical protein
MLPFASTAATATGILRDRLRFRDDGTFTIVQFNDTQDGPRTDQRTIQLQGAVLDEAGPDLAIINGDVIDSSPTTELEAKQAFNNVVLPMEERGIPWAVTFGNHDEDSSPVTGLDAEGYLAFLRQYPHNLNALVAEGVSGHGNQVLTIGSARADSRADAAAGPSADGSASADAFAVWLVDSGRYAPEQVAGQDFEGYPNWGWVQPDQVEWYRATSQALERTAGHLVPGLVFQHIALWEHRFMWVASVDARTEGDHERALAKHRIVGERNEDECTGPFNSGLFSAFLERGDVRGVFVGHDHINSYVGDYYGVQLGYAPATGFGPEAADGVLAGSELRLASDYGIDLSPTPQPIDPLPFPEGVA